MTKEHERPVSPTDDPYRQFKKWDEERRRTQVDEAQMREQAQLSLLTIDQVSSSAGADGLQYLSYVYPQQQMDRQTIEQHSTVKPAEREIGLASIAELDAEPQNPVEPDAGVAESGLTPLAQLEAAIASYFSPMVPERSKEQTVDQPAPSRESAGYGLTRFYKMLADLGHEPYEISDEKEVVEIESSKPVAKWYEHFANERSWMFEDVAEEYKKLCGTKRYVKSESSKKF
ncbi:hypothetical protein E8E13_007767 [Curvularia kusanoi]|uniref:Uncharacterized protein n=1 Tax=Curvularia kusanoi TaxID=90978 RepID=A0A9P4TJJ2_CURKU|nr:hypothetical protein E8E13_007767 [Curvularia kusanoi]